MNAITDAIGHETINRIGWVLVHFLWQGAAVAGALLAALSLGRRWSAHARYVVAYTALSAAAAMPVVTWVWLAPRKSSAVTSPAGITQPVIVARHAGSAPPIITDSLTGSRSPATTWRFEQLLPVTVLGWLIGVAVLAVYRAGGWVYVQHLRRTGQPVRDPRLDQCLARLRRLMRVGRLVRIVHCPRIDSPAVVGAVKPVILLPLACALNLAPAQLEAILAHELAHVRRHDYLLNLIQTAIETILFFHPAIWWMSRRIRAEREHAADDVALGATRDRAAYASALAALEELRTAAPPSPALAAQGGPLLARVRRVLGASPHASERATWWPAAAIAVFAVTVIVGVMNSRASANDAPATGTTGRSAVVACVDQNGQPVAGADVYLVDWFTGSGKAEITAPHPVKSGTDGAARFANLPTAPSLTGQMIAYARVPGKLAGLAMQDPQVVGGRPLDEPMRLELRPAVTLRGRVTGPPGAALDLAAVQMLALNNLQVHEGRMRSGGHLFRESFLHAPALVRDVFTYRVGRDGALMLTDIPDNANVIIGLHAPGLARELVSVRHKADQPMDFEVELQPQGVIEGRVDATAGAPLKGLRVEARSNDRPSRVGYSVPIEAQVREDGHFRIEHLPEGVYSIRLAEVPADWVAPIEATRVGYGEVIRDVIVPLGRGTALRGLVTDVESGQPLAGAWIGVSSVMEMESERVAGAGPTDINGRFEVRVPPGRVRVAVVRYPKGYSRDEDKPQHSQLELTIRKAEPPPEVQFKLRQGVRMSRDMARGIAPRVKVSGRLIDSTRQPIAGVAVQYRFAQRQPSGADRPSPFTVPKTRADGSYEFEVPVSEVEHIVFLDQGPTTAGQSKEFVPRDATPIHLEDVIVTPRAVVSQVSGVLVDPRGQPVRDAIVEINVARATRTSNDGQFSLDLYDNNPVDIRVQANSFQMQSWGYIPPGTRDARFALRPVNPRLPEWSEPPPLPDPARLVGQRAPELNVTWVARPDEAAQPPAPKRPDGRSTALLFVGAAHDVEGYRREIETFADACAERSVEPVVIFSPRFHETAVRGILAGANASVWAGIDRWTDDDTPVTFPGSTRMTYGTRERRGVTIFAIDADGVVRYEGNTPASLTEFLERR